MVECMIIVTENQDFENGEKSKLLALLGNLGQSGLQCCE